MRQSARKTASAFVLGAVVAAVGFYAGGLTRPSEAQAKGKSTVADATLARRYTPTFMDWVLVDLKAHHEMLVLSGGSQFHATVGMKAFKGGSRFTITMLYSNNEWGREFVKSYEAGKKKAIAFDVAKWRREGYDISLDDFEFIVKPTVELRPRIRTDLGGRKAY